MNTSIRNTSIQGALRSLAATAALVLACGAWVHGSVASRSPDPPAGSTVVALDAPARVFRAGRGGFAAGFVLVGPGRFDPESAFALRTAGGRRLPLRARVTGLHRDGSVRAMRLFTWLPAELATRASRFELIAAQPPAPVERIVVANGDRGVVVETGGARFEFSRDAGDFLPRIERRTAVLKDPSRPARFVGRCGGGSLASSDGAGIAVVEDDPLRAVVDVRCELRKDGGGAVAHGVARFTFRAGIPGAEFTLRLSAATSARFADLALELPMRRTAAKESIRVGFLPGGAVERNLAKGDVAAALALDGDSVIGAIGDSEIALDPAARCGLVALGGSWRGAGIAVVGSRMRPLAPRAIELDDSATISIVMLRGETHLEAGTEIEFDGGLALTGPDDRGALVESLSREPLPALIGFEADALEWVSPLAAAEHDPNDPFPKLIAALDRGISALSGWRDYGDHRLSGGFANLEYDVALALDLAALGARDARHLLVARDARRHFLLHDLSRGESGAPVGIPWRHGDDHRSHEFDPGHVFLGGLALGALIDDSPRAGAALREAVDALATLVRAGSVLSLERDYAWSLIAFHDAEWMLGNDATAAFRRPVLDELLAKQAPRGFFRIDRGREGGLDPPLGAFVATPWLTAGLTVEALAREYVARSSSVARIDREEAPSDPTLTVAAAESREGASRIAAAVRRTLDFLLVDARYENGEFAARVGYDSPGEVVLARDGVADPVDRLLLAAGIGRAAWILRDPALADLFEREVVVATSRMKRLPLSPNEAARALVAWRSIVDSRVRCMRP